MRNWSCAGFRQRRIGPFPLLIAGAVAVVGVGWLGFF